MNIVAVDNIDSQQIAYFSYSRDSWFVKEGSFLADTPKVVLLLLQQGIEPLSILCTKAFIEEHTKELSGIPIIYEATSQQMQDIVGKTLHHDCILHAKRPKPMPLNALGEHIVLLDGITSSENVGSINRTLAGLDIDSVMVSNRSPHPYTRRAVRVSMGYIHRLHYHLFEDTITTIQKLKSLGYTIYAAELDTHAIALSDVVPDAKWVLIMGHEGKGIDKAILNECDTVIAIEMQSDVKSFNVAVATAIITYTLTH